jgi:hypothetical protein
VQAKGVGGDQRGRKFITCSQMGAVRVTSEGTWLGLGSGSKKEVVDGESYAGRMFAPALLAKVVREGPASVLEKTKD